MHDPVKNTELEKILEKIDLNAPAPVEEPMRQYYFIKKARGYIQKKTKKETGNEAASAEKKGQATASPTASPVSTDTPSAATPTDDSDKQEMEKSDTGKPATDRTKWETFGIVGGALLLIIVLVLVRIRRRK